ncbi:MAG: hypothetical protein U1F77_03000 [Kiritimatiellia bacterium]
MERPKGAARVKGWRRFDRLVFWAGLCLCLGVQMRFARDLIRFRHEPPEVDDSYAYILKAVYSADGGMAKDHAALRDLWAQTNEPSSVEPAGFYRYKQRHQVFNYYHPLHSRGLRTLNAAGLDWLKAYRLIQAAGAGFIVLALAAFLRALHGPAGAGLGLAVLSVFVFNDQGLFELVVPSNLAFGAFLGSAGCAVAGGRIRLAGCAALGVGAMLLHPLGYFFLPVTCALLLSRSGGPVRRARWITLAVLAFGVVLAFGIPRLHSMPGTAAVGEVVGNPGDYWSGLRGSWEVQTRLMIEVVPFGVAGWAGLLASACAGIWLAPPPLRRPVLVTLVLSTVLLAASLLPVYPYFPANISRRAWMLPAILLIGASCSALADAAQAAARLLRGAVSPSGGPVAGRGAFVRAALLVALAAWVPAVRGMAARKAWTLRHMIERHPFRFDPQSWAVLGRLVPPGGRVWYGDDFSLYALLCRGMLNRGAVFRPALAGTPQEAAWAAAERDVPALAALNPLHRLPRFGGDGLWLDPARPLRVALPRIPSEGGVWLGLRNAGRTSRLTVAPAGENGLSGGPLLDREIPGGFEGFLPVECGWTDGAEIVIRVDEASDRLLLTGLRLSSTAVTRWPWNQGVTLGMGPGGTGGSAILCFDSATAFPGAPVTSEVVCDEGSLVIGRAVPSGTPRP